MNLKRGDGLHQHRGRLVRHTALADMTQQAAWPALAALETWAVSAMWRRLSPPRVPAH